MQYCPMANYHYVHNLWQSVQGDSEHFFVVGYFLKMEAFWSELLTGHALKKIYNTLYKPINFCIKNGFDLGRVNCINFNFRHAPKLSIGFNDSIHLKLGDVFLIPSKVWDICLGFWFRVGYIRIRVMVRVSVRVGIGVRFSIGVCRGSTYLLSAI